MSVKRLTEFDAHLCTSDETLRKAMQRVDELSRREGGRPYQFLIVVDEERRLIGTLSDGDFRRGIIAGCSLEDPVSRCTHRNPIVGRIGEEDRNAVLLANLAPQSSFLPILDGQDRIAELLVLTSDRQAACSALVMAGGFGKRLGERTRTTPKPLLPVGDRPILAHVMDRIAAVNPAKFYLSVHYLAEQVVAFGDARPDRDKIEYLHEDEPLGTAGALGLLPDPMPHPLIISNGDVLTSLDFVAFKTFFERHDFDALVAVAQHSVTIPFGVIRHDNTGRFLRIDEKPSLNHYVSAGIYMLSPEFRALVRRGERIDLPDLLARGQQIGLNVGLFPMHEYWTDVGRPEDLEKAEKTYGQN